MKQTQCGFGLVAKSRHQHRMELHCKRFEDSCQITATSPRQDIFFKNGLCFVVVPRSLQVFSKSNGRKLKENMLRCEFLSELYLRFGRDAMAICHKVSFVFCDVKPAMRAAMASPRFAMRCEDMLSLLAHQGG